MLSRRRVRDVALALPGFEAACRRLSAGHVKVLMYHRFGRSSAGGVDEATLARQAELIVQGHDVVSVDELIRRVKAGEPPRRSTVAVTVDDGYRDFLEVAFPVFERYRIPATVFVATDFVDGQWLWWDRLRYVLLQSPVSRLSVVAGDTAFEFDLCARSGRIDAWGRIADRCRFLPDEAKWAVLRQVERAAGVQVPESPPPEFAAVTWSDIQMMAARGMSFAPHTASHPILTRVGLDAVINEVSRARRALEDKAGVCSRAFAYPQGGPADFNDQVIEAIKAAGIEGAFIAYQQNASPCNDRYRIPRYQVTGDMLEFRWKLCGGNYLWRHFRGGFGWPTHELSEAYWAGDDQEVVR